MALAGGMAYLYDGSFEGLLCCVYESYYSREMPEAIFSFDSFEPCLWPVRRIATDPERAARVQASIRKKISPDALHLARYCGFTCVREKELLVLKFLRLGFRMGRRVTDMLQNPTVHAVHKAVMHLEHEAHLLTGFVRFSQAETMLYSEIDPKNFVLPLLAPHFCDRFPEETFLIFDRTNRAALFHLPEETALLPVEDLELPELADGEQEYRMLWKRYCAIAAVEGRTNPVCQRGNCALRYRGTMLEFQD